MSILVVCDECAVGIANDDWTHQDAHEDQEVSQSTAHFLEANGYLAHVGDTYEGKEAEKEASHGYYTCPCCGCVALGGSAFSSTA